MQLCIAGKSLGRAAVSSQAVSTSGGCGSVLLGGKSNLSADGSGNLRVVGLNSLGQVRGAGVESGFVGVPVNSIGDAISADVRVGSLHNADLSIVDQTHGAGGLLLDTVLRLKAVVKHGSFGGWVVVAADNVDGLAADGVRLDVGNSAGHSVGGLGALFSSSGQVALSYLNNFVNSGSSVAVSGSDNFLFLGGQIGVSNLNDLINGGCSVISTNGDNFLNGGQIGVPNFDNLVFGGKIRVSDLNNLKSGRTIGFNRSSDFWGDSGWGTIFKSWGLGLISAYGKDYLFFNSWGWGRCRQGLGSSYLGHKLGRSNKGRCDSGKSRMAVMVDGYHRGRGWHWSAEEKRGGSWADKWGGGSMMVKVGDGGRSGSKWGRSSGKPNINSV